MGCGSSQAEPNGIVLVNPSGLSRPRCSLMWLLYFYNVSKWNRSATARNSSQGSCNAASNQDISSESRHRKSFDRDLAKHSRQRVWLRRAAFQNPEQSFLQRHRDLCCCTDSLPLCFVAPVMTPDIRNDKPSHEVRTKELDR